MAQFIYTMNRVGKVVPPKRVILRDISLSFFPGAKIGVLGLNGSGKSTLLRIMAGIDKEFEGEARPQPGIQIGFLQQEPQLDETKDVRGNVEMAVQHIKDALAGLDAVYAAYAEPDADFDKIAAEQARLEAIIQAADGHNLERQLEVAADALRLPPWDADVTKISGGERRRVALCQLLLSKPDMLLLDEPTNHLDAESVRWLEHYLEAYPGTVIAVTHDRYFLDNVAGWILELDRGHGIPWQGNYSSWLEQKEKRLRSRSSSRNALKKMLERELEWVRQNPKARQAKSKARMQRFEELQSRDFQERNETNEIYIPPGPRLGELVVEANNLSKSYGEKLLFDNLNFNLPQGGIVGIIGPNGAGKTTLFRLITGPGASRMAARSASALRCSSPMSTSHGSRSTTRRPSGPKSRTASTSSRSATTRYPRAPTSATSTSAERSSSRRSASCRAVNATACIWPRCSRSGGNVILLDEPTNDLDIETLRALEEALLSVPGLRGGDLARSLVPRPHRHPHPRVRRQQRGRLVRGQLFRVRRRSQEAPGRGRGAAASRTVPQPARLMQYEIDGASLTLADLRRFEQQRPLVCLASRARAVMEQSAAIVQATVASGRVAYGINTGFGAFANRVIPAQKTRKLQLNLVRSHTCGVGEPLEPALVRRMLLLKANSLAAGHLRRAPARRRRAACPAQCRRAARDSSPGLRRRLG
jgi:energy-dependent translational throttle protein EttA